MARQRKTITPPRYDEITELICPLPGKNPVGPYIRYGPLFDNIVTARTQEDAALPQGVWKREIKHANWPEVVALCKDFLSHHSKDLQIAAWLMQAWYYTKALNGLAQGLNLFNQLCTDYWVQIHPHSADAQDLLEERYNLIHWINEKLSPDLHRVQITKPTNPKVAIFTFDDALQLSDPAKSKANSETVVIYQQSCRETPASFYNTIISGTTVALDELKHLEHTLDTHIGDNLFSLSRLRQTLESIQHFAQTQCKKRTKEPENKQTQQSETKKASSKPMTTSSEKTVRTPPANTNKDCQQIYQQLEDTIINLKKIHPQSPAPYLIQKAISLDQKSLQEWFEDMRRYNLDISAVQEWLGILPQNDD